jgi:hypothetical protein
MIGGGITRRRARASLRIIKLTKEKTVINIGLLLELHVATTQGCGVMPLA